MKDYTIQGYDGKMRKISSFAGRPRDYKSALDDDYNQEATPYLPPTAVSKGTVQTNLGGLLEVRDTTGGTVLFTVNPTTGVVTIAGSIQNQVALNLGTITDTVIAGQSVLSGTLTNNRLINNGTWNNGTFNNAVVQTPAITGGTVTNGNIHNPTIGTPALTGGTVNPLAFSANGTVGVSGSIIYLKNLAPGDLGTVVFTKGLVTSIA